MADGAIDPILPAHGAEPVRQHDHEPPLPPRHAPLVIPGRIVAVAPGRPHDGEHHQLDVSVGGSAYTEIVLRVANAAYGHLEGRQAALHVAPE